MTRTSGPRPESEAGFAYLWVLLLVAFMGIGLTLGAEVYTTSLQRDREKELLAIGRQFRTAIGRYYETRAPAAASSPNAAIAAPMDIRQYPASLEDLLRDSRSPGVRRHLRKIFVDPMTGQEEWDLVTIAGKIVGVHSLSERTPIKQDHFESDDALFKGKQKYSEWVFSYPSNIMQQMDTATSSSPLATPIPSAQSPALQGSSSSRAFMQQSSIGK